MFKKLSLVFIFSFFSLQAMEEHGYAKPDTNVCKFKLCKTVHMTLPGKPFISWPAEATRLSPFERQVATKLYDKTQSGLNALFERAKEVLSTQNDAEQVVFLQYMLSKFMNVQPHQTCMIQSKDRLETVLISLGLFCELENAGNGVRGIWDKLIAKKEKIDKRTFTQISLDDKLLINSMFKKIAFLEDCTQKIICKQCVNIMSDYLAEFVVSQCCKDKVNLGFACNHCALLIKRKLIIKIKELAFGLNHFGVPLENEQHKIFAQWADLEIN